MQRGIRDMAEFAFLWPAPIMATDDFPQGAVVVPFLLFTIFRIYLVHGRQTRRAIGEVRGHRTVVSLPLASRA